MFLANLNKTSFPNSSRYDEMAQSSQGEMGVIYVERPTETADETAIVFCKTLSDTETETNISIRVRSGGKADVWFDLVCTKQLCICR